MQRILGEVGFAKAGNLLSKVEGENASNNAPGANGLMNFLNVPALLPERSFLHQGESSPRYKTVQAPEKTCNHT